MPDVSKEPQDEAKTIPMHFLKTSGYRTFYIDGAFGGITPHGTLYAEFFLERLATPTKVVYKAQNGEDGHVSLTELEGSREGKEGIIREIECGIVMNIDTARILSEWLLARIGEHNDTFGRRNKDTLDASE
jgi:hypothetical protein